MSDGGGHLALVPMLTLLHGRLRLPICKTGFYFGSGFGQKAPTLSIENIEKNPTNALMFLRCIAHPQMPHSILGCMD